ncbi:MAG: glycosyltransferase family 2 protein [Bacilli bacterium]|nr:glycosyltransferase family 2 protein [Bacilli bacterium]
MKKVSNKPLISVVVPIYNVEEYLDKCVQSIVNQTYKNLEIILVDDGSPDNCPKMCDEWVLKDKRIRVIHKHNGGLSDARNAGIDIAKGEYISFVDSDDYLELSYIDFLYDNLVTYNADISMGKQYVRYPKKTFNTGTGDIYVLNSHDCFDKLLYSEDFDVSAWAKLYKTILFNGIRYPKGRLYEDSATTYKLIDKSNIIVLNSKPIYNYIIRNNSISNCIFSEKKMDLITSTNEMCNYITEKYPDLKQGCDRRIMYAYLSTLTQLVKSKKTEKKYKIELMKYIKNNRSYVLKDKRIPKRDRLGLISTYLGFKSYKIFWKIYSLIR